MRLCVVAAAELHIPMHASRVAAENEAYQTYRISRVPQTEILRLTAERW